MAGRRLRVWWIAGLLGLLLLAFVGNSARSVLGVSAGSQTPGDIADLLVPHFRVQTPPGEGPFPTAILFSGCDGPNDNLPRLARALNAAGWAAVLTDSHAPRGYQRSEVWPLICAGQLLNGAERAADVAVAIAHVEELGLASHVALIGASHGGWAILEYLAYRAQGQVPPLLTDWPEGPAPSIIGAVLIYPFCGPLGVLAGGPIPPDPPMQLHLVKDDQIAEEAFCVTLFGDRPGVDTQWYSGVTHGFDQTSKAPFSILEFDPAEAERSVTRTVNFLSGLIRSRISE